MQMTIILDDELIAKAEKLTGLSEKSALVTEALKALIQRESARHLAALGGLDSEVEYVPRRQSKSD